MLVESLTIKSDPQVEGLQRLEFRPKAIIDFTQQIAKIASPKFPSK